MAHFWYLTYSTLKVWSGEGNGTPLQYSCLENPTDGWAWWAAVHGVAKSWTRLSDFTFTSHFHALEKEMATHSSVLAWRIPGTREPGGLPSMGSHRVGHDWSDLASKQSCCQTGQKMTLLGVWEVLPLPITHICVCEDRFSSQASTKTFLKTECRSRYENSAVFIWGRYQRRFQNCK